MLSVYSFQIPSKDTNAETQLDVEIDTDSRLLT